MFTPSGLNQAIDRVVGVVAWWQDHLIVEVDRLLRKVLDGRNVADGIVGVERACKLSVIRLAGRMRLIRRNVSGS